MAKIKINAKFYNHAMRYIIYLKLENEWQL